MKQTGGFTAASCDPEKWAKLIKNSGADTPTAKHHDEVMARSTSIGNTGKSRATRILIYPLKVFKISRRIFLLKDDKKAASHLKCSLCVFSLSNLI